MPSPCPGSADPAAVRSAAQILIDEVTRLEQVASRFRADSEISGVNRAHGTWVPASSLLVQLVEVALAAAESTGGLVNPCLRPPRLVRPGTAVGCR